MSPDFWMGYGYGWIAAGVMVATIYTCMWIAQWWRKR